MTEIRPETNPQKGKHFLTDVKCKLCESFIDVKGKFCILPSDD